MSVDSQHCGNCFYSRDYGEKEDSEPVFTCRKNPPVYGTRERSVWPVVQVGEWCGEWQEFELDDDIDDKMVANIVK